MNFSPSDGLSGEPDLLSLSGQTMSQKLKSPRIWTEGGLLPLCTSLRVNELLKSKLFSYGTGGKTSKWINAFLCYRQ